MIPTPTRVHLSDADTHRLLNEPIRRKPHSVRRLRAYYLDPQSAFTWFVLLPFGFVWVWGSTALLVQKLILTFHH